MNEEKILDISWKTIIKISLAIICFYFLYQLKNILIWFIFALVISVLFNPAIDFLQKRKIPRAIAVIIVYFSIFLFFGFLIWLIAPIIAFEIQNFVQSFPEYLEKISPFLKEFDLEVLTNSDALIKNLIDSLQRMGQSILNALFIVFGGVLSTIFVITTAIFLSMEEKIIERILFLVFPSKYETTALNIWRRSQKKITQWFSARIASCFFVGVLTCAVLLIFKIKYPFILGLLAGIFNFIPYIGPFITGILLFLITFSVDSLKSIFIIIAFILIQNIENNILSPLLMKKFIDVPPVLVLFALVAGGELWGFLGSILAIPLAGILFEFIKEFLEKRKEKEIKSF